MIKITNLKAQEIPDSRGNPTIEVELTLGDETTGQASVPSGASTGKYEATTLPAMDAVVNIENEIAQRLIDRDFDQSSLDQELITLDGTTDKNRLGANAILGVSLAFAHAFAKSQGKELFKTINSVQGESSRPEVSPRMPVPMFNILNGGKHAQASTDIQEFMIVPLGASSFADSLAWGKAIWQKLKEILEAKNLTTELGDEGGFAPQLASNTEAIDLIVEAIKQAGFAPGKQVALALDIAASELLTDGQYIFRKNLSPDLNDPKKLTSEGLVNWYEELSNKYPIISIEDGLGEDDWVGWQNLTARLGDKINLVGDDLFVTNPARLQKGIAQKVANAIIIKPNQIGTLTETLEVIKIAKQAGYKTIVSHRSGETLDATITDLAVAISADFIKAGAPARPERLAKYNRLLEIEDKISRSNLED